MRRGDGWEIRKFQCVELLNLSSRWENPSKEQGVFKGGRAGELHSLFWLHNTPAWTAQCWMWRHRSAMTVIFSHATRSCFCTRSSHNSAWYAVSRMTTLRSLVAPLPCTLFLSGLTENSWTCTAGCSSRRTSSAAGGEGGIQSKPRLSIVSTLRDKALGIGVETRQASLAH